jgi:biopolymer transport protein TolR
VQPSGNGDQGIIAGINVTPLVDITLVLLIIFMVTAKIIVTSAVPLELPRAATAEEVQVVFSVIVPEQGPTLVNGEAVVDPAALALRAGEALRRDPGLRAVVQADGGVAHRRVIAVLDALKVAGVARIAFAALPAEAARP